MLKYEYRRDSSNLVSSRLASAQRLKLSFSSRLQPLAEAENLINGLKAKQHDQTTSRGPVCSIKGAVCSTFWAKSMKTSQFTQKLTCHGNIGTFSITTEVLLVSPKITQERQWL